MPRPMLDDVELQQVQGIEAEEKEALSQHGVPALEGDFLQDLGRRATRVKLTGVITGEKAGEGLKKLREKFQAAEPLPFAADIATATQLDKVLIEEMGIRELAGKPERFEYSFTLVEFTPPRKPKEEPPPPPPTPPPPPVETGTLVVEVNVEGQSGFDFSKVTVSLEGTQEDKTVLTRTLTNRKDNVWTEENVPPGQYTVKAVGSNPQAMTGSAEAAVRAGQTVQVAIKLKPGAIIATTFVVHFRFDKAFIEPCMRPVLKQAADHARSNPNEKLVIVGHTDLTGPDEYNQSLSERRARSVFAYLTFGVDAAAKTAALNEWNELRQQATGGLPSIKDSWSTREYQYMLQDLAFYSGNVDEQHGPATDAAVRAFQQDKGLAVDGIVGDDTWSALIEAYLIQDNLAMPGNQLLRNVKDGCDGGILKWLGCGVQDPVKNVRQAWRPNRRVELLFVRTDKFPCQEPQPDTFDLPTPGTVNPKWCLGPGKKNDRACFVVKHLPPGGKPKKDEWTRQPAEPGSIAVRGSIKFEDGTPAANVKYVLIAPDGEFMDGEKTSGPKRGEGVPGRTKANGTFEYPKKPKGIGGIYTMEIEGPFVARLDGEPPEKAKGNVVCKRLDGSSDFNVIVLLEGCKLLSSVHFDSEKSFIRPAAKRALKTLADFIQRNPQSRRLLLVGHTDLAENPATNRDLSVRRARAIFAFLASNPPDPGNPTQSIWLSLSQAENWGVREIQFMLSDLGFYCFHRLNGSANVIVGAATSTAIRAFKNRSGLGDNDVIDDAFRERLFSEYIAHNGASVPAGRFLQAPPLMGCGADHPIDIRGGAPFGGASEKNRRVEFLIFPKPPRRLPTSPTDCSQYSSWSTPCEKRGLELIGPKRDPIGPPAVDPADAEEVVAATEVANWENAFDFDPADPITGEIRPTGNHPRADFIDRDLKRFFVQVTDLDRRGAGPIRARIKTVNAAGADVNPFVEFELIENANDPGIFRSNSMLLVSDEIDNGEINNGSAPGATPFQARGIANGALNDPVYRAEIGGEVVVEYSGTELGRLPVCDPDCIKTIPVNIVILRKTDGTACTTEADVQERVHRLQQNYMQCCIRFAVTIRTATAAEMPAGVILSNASGISINPTRPLADRTALTGEERSLFESTLNARSPLSPGGGRTDVIQVFYANFLEGAAATAISYRVGSYTTPSDDIMNITVIGADDPEENSTLPHEMLHLLLNRPHDASSAIRTNLFFSATLGEKDFPNTTVTSNKRIPEEQFERILTNPSGVVP